MSRMKGVQPMKTTILLMVAAVAFAAPPTYKVINKIKVGGGVRWDYAYLDSANHRLYVSHGTQTEVIDTATDKLVGTIPDTKGVHGVAVANDLGRGFTSNGGGNPEFAQVDGKGHIYVNIEDKNEIVEIDAKDALVSKRYSIAPCDGPSGLAFDPKKGYLYSVCGNKMMIVSDPAAGKVLGTAAIGGGTDGVAFDDGYAFSANGADGTITMVGETSPGKFAPVATIQTQRGARTIAADQKAHKLYLPAAEYGPAGESKDGKKGRPQPLADSFQVVVVGR